LCLEYPGYLSDPEFLELPYFPESLGFLFGQCLLYLEVPGLQYFPGFLELQ
jgi:hypothetical protein